MKTLGVLFAGVVFCVTGCAVPEEDCGRVQVGVASAPAEKECSLVHALGSATLAKDSGPGCSAQRTCLVLMPGESASAWVPMSDATEDSHAKRLTALLTTHGYCPLYCEGE